MTNLSNTVDTFENVMKDIRKYAQQGGIGDNARANTFERIVRGARDGAIDTIKRDKDGNESKDKTARDHCQIIYDDYVATYGKANNHQSDTVAGKVAALRSAALLGQRFGQDGVELMNKVQVLLPELKKAKIKTLSPFEARYRVAVAQLKAEHRLNADEVRAIITPESKERDVAAYLKTAEKALTKACELDDNDANRDALETVKQALAAFVTAEQKTKDMAALAELQARLGIAA